MTDTFAILSLSCLYLFTRLVNINAMPVFGDEAIYVRWSQIIRSVETLRFIPLTDGKQPLFMWLTIPFFKFISDPLVAARTLSIISGLGIMITIYLILRVLFNSNIRTSVIGSFIYLTSFYAYFFDRLATADTLLAFFATLSFLLSALLIKHHRLDIALILGGVLGMAWLTKSPAVYFIVLSLLSFFITNYKRPLLLYLPTVSGILAVIIYNILRLGPQFHQISIRNKDYIWPITDILRHPLDPLKPHFSDILSITSQYLPPLMMVSFLILLFVTLTLHRKTIQTNDLILWLWFLAPLITSLAVSKVFTARYVLFSFPFFYIIFARLLSRHLDRTYILLLSLIYFASNLTKIYYFTTNTFNFRLPSTESGYLADWTSGWGIREASQYLKQRSTIANIIVGTEGSFGTLPDGLQIYTNQVPKLTVIGLGLGLTQIPDNLVNAKNYGDEVYLLFNKSRLDINSTDMDRLTLVQSYPKPGGDQLLLYRF